MTSNKVATGVLRHLASVEVLEDNEHLHVQHLGKLNSFLDKVALSFTLEIHTSSLDGASLKLGMSSGVHFVIKFFIRVNGKYLLYMSKISVE